MDIVCARKCDENARYRLTLRIGKKESKVADITWAKSSRRGSLEQLPPSIIRMRNSKSCNIMTVLPFKLRRIEATKRSYKCS